MAVELPHGVAKGHWHRYVNSVWIRCPKCSYAAALDHEIAADGTVTPSVECPSGCGFHDAVKLADWVPPIQTPGAGV